MSVEAGQKLGKYQLIEKVGQGGMAVVYRGHDTSLNREVAIKVLHNHLAEHREARERFGREAHAVAKLRHENILEIHDFSGLDEGETYIVTEFIEGCTLKDFISDHPIHFPEIGAMIATQICQALAHAHGLGVLHRDVKPENVMIRSDGVVKLTDFGIAQMIDLQRMTVTGQLLGSPAYMAPEHVEGRDLDFRTDVFAVGIVLYQLVTGELPFQGKNPHEILKRIAECEYLAPARLNQRVGKDLNTIIRTALSRDPKDRYADISLMQQALEEYLDGSGIQNPRDELGRFFDAAPAYQMALEKRLVDHLSDRGKLLLASNRIAALELFNRVLSIDAGNEEVLEHLNRIGSRQRALRITTVLTAALLLAGLAFVAKKRFAAQEASEQAAIPWDSGAKSAASDAALALMAPDAAQVVASEGGVELEELSDAAPLSSDARESMAKLPAIRRRTVDASILEEPAAPKARKFLLKLTPRGSEYRLGNGPWTLSSSGSAELKVPQGEQLLLVRNVSCCQETQQVIGADEPEGAININLRFLPGQLTPTCSTPGVRVKVNGKAARLGYGATIPIDRLIGTEVVLVEFFSADRVDEQRVTIGATDAVEVACKF